MITPILGNPTSELSGQLLSDTSTPLSRAANCDRQRSAISAKRLPAIRSSVITEAAKRGVSAQDALTLFPPTRTYTDAEIRKQLAQQAIDGVLLINVGDTGFIREYAGTVFSGCPKSKSLKLTESANAGIM
jgi:hypothetical protein